MMLLVIVPSCLNANHVYYCDYYCCYYLTQNYSCPTQTMRPHPHITMTNDDVILSKTNAFYVIRLLPLYFISFSFSSAFFPFEREKLSNFAWSWITSTSAHFSHRCKYLNIRKIFVCVVKPLGKKGYTVAESCPNLFAWLDRKRFIYALSIVAVHFVCVYVSILSVDFNSVSVFSHKNTW